MSPPTKSTLLLLSILHIFVNPVTMSQSFTSDRLLLAGGSRFRPLVAKTYDQLIFVSFPSYPEPRIKLESEKIGYEPCEIGFPSMDDTEYPLGLDSLANGQLLLTLLGASWSLDFQTRYLLTLIVDPETCGYESVLTSLNATIPGENRDYRESIVVLPGEKEFDVFLTSHANCSEGKACRLRYDRKGTLMGFTELDRPDNATGWSVNTIEEKDLSSGYFYTVFTANETIVKRLDEDLKIEHELWLDKTFLYSDAHGCLGRCLGVTSTELHCELYAADLAVVRSSVSIDAQPYKSFMRAVKLFNLSHGDALVFLVLQVYGAEPSAKDGVFSTYLHRLDAYGRASQAFKFQDEICKDFGEIKLSTMREGFFCASISCRDAVQTKCVVFSA